jgi:hypothetical protein
MIIAFGDAGMRKETASDILILAPRRSVSLPYCTEGVTYRCRWPL